MSGFVVADPGGRREMPMMAAGFARAGLLRAFMTPFGEPPGAPEASILQWLPRAIRTRIASEFRRRELPSALGEASVEHVASLSDAMEAVSRRVPVVGDSISPSLARMRGALFDRGVARRLEFHDDGVVAVSGAAKWTLSRAAKLGVQSFLECPVAHHRWAARVLLEEARLQPRYAPTLQFHRLPQHFERRLDDEIELAEKLIVLSTYQSNTFVDEGVNPDKLLLVPLGVDTDLFQPRERSFDSTFRVLFVGQITQRKGLSYLIDGFRRAQIPRSELVLLGNIIGTDAPWRTTGGVRHVAHVPAWSLPSLYAQADVYVLPSLVEGFPLTAVEAMASGLPVILSEYTFARDVVTEAVDGYIVPIRDSEAIADRLLALYNDPAHRHAMGTAARKTAERYSWERYGERIVGALTKATKSSGSVRES